jgi:hypothetical protein
MPRLPDISAFGARPTPTPSLGTVGISGGGDQSAPGQQLVRSGQQIDQVGDQIYAANRDFEAKFEARAKIEQHKLDTVRAEDAFNKLREHELDLSAGESGYTKVKGIDATSTPVLQTYNKRFADRAKELGDSLGNDDQRAMFNARAQVAGLGFREGLLRHLATQGKVAAEQQWEATKVVEGKTITANWAEPDVIATSVLRLDAGLKRQAQDNGWTPEFLEAQRQMVMGKVWDTVIDQAVANGNLTYAKEIYDKNKDQVAPATAKELAGKVVDADQRQRFNGYQSAYLATQDNLGGLKSLLTSVTQDPKLDDARKNTLIGRIQSQQQSIQRAQEAAADRAARRAETELNAMVTRIGQGWEPTIEQMGGLIQAAKGRPQLAGLVNQVIGTANATREFRTADPMVQEQMINQATIGVREGRIEPKMLSTFKSISEAQQTERNQDPISYSVRQQIVPATDIAAKPLDVSNPAKLDPNQMQSRLDLARGMAGRYRTPLKPLTEQERALAVSTLKLADPEQKREYFRGLSLATGDDFNGYKAIMAQIAPDDPVTAMAGIFARRGFKDPKAGTASDLLLDGIGILRPNARADGKPSGGTLLPMPAEREMRTKFDDYVRDAYSGSAEARNVTFQAAQAIYASMSRKAGDRDTTVLDANRWQKAVEMSTGGVTKYNGRNTVKPWGMTESDFSDQVDTRLRTILGSGALDPSMTMSKLRDLPLRPIGDGQYVLSAGDTDLGDKAGKRIVLDFNKPLQPEALAARKRMKGTTSANQDLQAEIQRQVNEAMK